MLACNKCKRLHSEIAVNRYRFMMTKWCESAVAVPSSMYVKDEEAFEETYSDLCDECAEGALAQINGILETLNCVLGKCATEVASDG